ncbi:MAG: hypothetical protein OES29_11230 [Desulfuromonadales bacterium]|jgi:hypothetical protein|nr:hypothetical protein [Desulfuromonadales bacterium]
MSYQMSVIFMGDYVEARSTGDKSYQTAVALWREIIRVCDEHDCYKVLGIGQSTTPMPTMDAMNHTKLFQDFSITRKYQIAWVELNREAVGSIKFLETVLLNRGLLNGKLLPEVAEAKRWLLAQ